MERTVSHDVGFDPADRFECTVETAIELDTKTVSVVHAVKSELGRMAAHPDVSEVEALTDLSLRTVTEPFFDNTKNRKVRELDECKEAHSVVDDGLSGKKTTIAVTDTGVDASHAAFDGVDVSAKDMSAGPKDASDTVGHGTAVAGHIARVAPNAHIIMLKIAGSDGSLSMGAIVEAYNWLLENADQIDIVNMSWGSKETSQQLNDIHNKLAENGVRDVVSAGNSGSESGSPATAERAFSVGASDGRGNIAPFSSYNESKNPDVAAVGVNVRLAQAAGTAMGTDLSGPYVAANGTSFSAPFVAGCCGRYNEAHPERGVEEFATQSKQTSPSRSGSSRSASKIHEVDELKDSFVEYADDIPETPRDGAGLLDYEAALDGTEGEDSNEGDDGKGGDDGKEGKDGDSGKYQKYVTLLESVFGTENVTRDGSEVTVDTVLFDFTIDLGPFVAN